MQDRHLYEYAVIRVLPKVEREEFLNVGIIFFCKREKFLKVIYKLDEARLRCLAADIDLDQIEKNLQSLKKISEGAKDGGPIAQLDVPSRFRWLTAVRSSVIQTSRPHPGMCGELDTTIERIFREMVL
ncbi:DUF3037 domain-containing protein [Zunongwangia sp. F260]|uniref:DUF3037 domain-containing protein n=2 Tax=Autumnicola TaxID=3160927 RepID=A0ABU3CN58_9FLAO|nr:MULTISPECIES: DUF3037 domain-containing protein [unclassified Zunongwangia]MDT0647794.1 DUF3037 domain-containing protein [Zunongwangia sp. F260]MDT0685956.1 DUF3037 domain-containing protein [Zunongwangia sp. F225]